MTIKQPKIAIFPNIGLGDGLVYLVLAHNLQRNHCQMTVYHNGLYRLRSIFAGFDIQPSAHKNNSDAISQAYDYCILHDDISQQLFANNVNKHHIIFKSDKEKSNLSQNQSCNQESDNLMIRKLLQYSGLNLSHHNPEKSVVQNIVEFCQNKLQMSDVDKQVPICNKLADTKKTTQVIIHPDSSIYKKNWSPTRYIALAKRIEKNGQKVIFSVAPAEFEKWALILAGRFCLTQFNLVDLAYQLKACKCFIGSDSGPGHLASLLGTPTLTIFSRKRKCYTWRPGWSSGQIATPLIKINFIKTKTHLRSFLSVSRVYKQYLKLLA